MIGRAEIRTGERMKVPGDPGGPKYLTGEVVCYRGRPGDYKVTIRVDGERRLVERPLSKCQRLEAEPIGAELQEVRR